MRGQVSVIMSVYNGEKYLRQAIESVLAQTYKPIEFILVNDGSVDGTEEILKQYTSQILYITRSNQGQPAALNLGMAMAKSDYLTFLDADDLYMADKIALQMDILDQRPELDMVFGHLEQFFSPELSEERKAQWVCPKGLSPGYMAAAGLFRKECFDKVGLFNEEQKIGAFLDWYMRSEEKKLKSHLIPNKVLSRRIHENNVGISSQNSRHEYVQIVKAALKRRGLNGVA